jgi:hypothetical protein
MLDPAALAAGGGFMAFYDSFKHKVVVDRRDDSLVVDPAATFALKIGSGVVRPMALGFKSDEIRRVITLGPAPPA